MVEVLDECVLITPEERQLLVSELESIGFYVTLKAGHVHVNEPEPTHPAPFMGNEFYDGADLPVAIVLPYKGNVFKFELLNTEVDFPKDYHSQVRELFEQLFDIKIFY